MALSRRFEGKNVMVTGAGTGFGSCLAIQAATEGAKTVVVHYRSSDAGAQATAQRVREAGSEALLVQGDISIGADIERMVQEVYDALGSLDVLVNNVGDMAVEQQSWREVT
jgi:3-oxoacyl-[acyl-carrier protein] reductase